ncbi:DUF397 domain-containing protein [Actinocatenispora sera]|uniref:DUF397 domain-containing protein n=1 Tax=Actinocatenispora sera TaxID=390989 RepID=UPI0004C3F23C|nr:DUF397 domain-containing protein [Actinocatenispora sera]
MSPWRHIVLSSPDFSSARWRKGPGSGDGNCVEVAQVPEAVGVRDSKDRQGPVLAFAPAAWESFLGDVQCGTFDL